MENIGIHGMNHNSTKIAVMKFQWKYYGCGTTENEELYYSFTSLGKLRKAAVKANSCQPQLLYPAKQCVSINIKTKKISQ